MTLEDAVVRFHSELPDVTVNGEIIYPSGLGVVPQWYEKNLECNNGLVDRCSVNICVGTRNTRCRSNISHELGEIVLISIKLSNYS